MTTPTLAPPSVDALDALDGRLDALPTVSLDALDAQAGLLTRRDRKYLVPAPVAERLLDALTGRIQVLDIDGRRRFRYESTYFDTPSHVSYLTAAWRRPRRFKVRTRTYLDTGRCVLEVKTRDRRGQTVKTQHLRTLDDRGRLGSADRALVGAVPEIGPAGWDLVPALTTRYTRATVLVADEGARATIDTDLAVIAPDGRIARLVDMVVIESKSSGAASSVDRALWAMGHRPTRISKFGTGLAALHPDLPANRWRRALDAPWRLTPGVRSA